MKILPTYIRNILVFEPEVLDDERGFTYQFYNRQALENTLKIDSKIDHEWHLYSAKNVIRGLNYQASHSSGKLTRVLFGEIYEVIVDLRKDSPTLGKWIGLKHRAEDKRTIWVPKGCAHGFLVLTDSAEVEQKSCGPFDPSEERTILWNDPDLAIPWPIEGEPVLSKLDQEGSSFRDAELMRE